MICFLFMLTSAEAERVYSVMNHIKNKRRNRLVTFMLNIFVFIRMNGVKTLEAFDAMYDEVFNIWYSMKSRRNQIKAVVKDEHFVVYDRLSKLEKADLDWQGLLDSLFISEHDDRFFSLGFADDEVIQGWKELGFINESDIEEELDESDSSESDDEDYGILTIETKNKRRQWKRIDKKERKEWETNQARLREVLRLRNAIVDVGFAPVLDGDAGAADAGAEADLDVDLGVVVAMDGVDDAE